MNQLLDEIGSRPVGQRVAVWVGSMVLVALWMWSSVYSEKNMEYDDIRDKVFALKAQVIKEVKIARNLDRFKEEVRKLDIRLQYALRELPDEREIPELLSSISGLAKDSGLDVNLFKVNAEQLVDFYTRVPVEMSVSGTFHNIVFFFNKVANLPRIVNISHISLVNPRKERGKIVLSGGFIATTFRYVSPEERDKNKPKASSVKRRRRR